jgi:hypothetical protein
LGARKQIGGLSIFPLRFSSYSKVFPPPAIFDGFEPQIECLVAFLGLFQALGINYLYDYWLFQCRNHNGTEVVYFAGPPFSPSLSGAFVPDIIDSHKSQLPIATATHYAFVWTAQNATICCCISLHSTQYNLKRELINPAE